MKKCVLVILVLLSLSCTLVDSYNDNVFESRIQKADIYYLEEFDELKNIYGIIAYLNNTIEYRDDTYDEWSSIEATLTRGWGDCEDFAIAFMNIYYVVFNEKCDLVLLDTGNRKVTNGGWINHACVQLPSGILCDAQGGTYYDLSTSFIYPFDLFFNF